MKHKLVEWKYRIRRTDNVKLILIAAVLISAWSWAPSITTVDAFSASPSPTPTPTPAPSRRRRASPPVRSASSASGPKGANSRRSPRRSPRTEREADVPARRKSRERDVSAEEIFDPRAITRSQPINEKAPPVSLFSAAADESSPPPLRLRSSAVGQVQAQAETESESESETKSESRTDSPSEPPRSPSRGKAIPADAHFEQLSLDSLFPHRPSLNFSHAFFHDDGFREAIRTAVRQDIFYSTPAYADLPPKVADMMLDDDSSLQGSWNCVSASAAAPPSESKSKSKSKSKSPSPDAGRMKRLTVVLQDKLGPDAPTGDEFFMAIGALCGFNPSTHFIDIIGIKDRRIPHSWHQDSGRSVTKTSTDDTDAHDDISQDELSKTCYTVVLGFPCENEYDCAGVFSHVVKLAEEHFAPDGHNHNEPLLFEGLVDDNFIIRPSFGLGREILRYRDVDILHSAPDVQYRSSVMRFM